MDPATRTAPDPPPAPEGYDEPYPFTYSTPALLFLSVPMFPLSSVGFGWVLRQVQGPEVFTAVFDVTEVEDESTITLELIDVAVLFVAALVVTVVVHELIHGAVMHYYGQEVTYGVNPAIGAFYAVAFEQFQLREQLFAIGLAPLACITVVVLPLLAAPVPIIALTAYLVLLCNATGAVGDLYVLWRLWRMPEGTPMYDADLRHWYVFEPLVSSGSFD